MEEEEDKPPPLSAPPGEEEGRCVACGEIVKVVDLVEIKREEESPPPNPPSEIMEASEGPPDEEVQGPTPPGENEKPSLLPQFCRLLHIHLEPQEELNASLCLPCQNQVTLLLHLQRQLEELERDLQRGLQDFRRRCEQAEETFQLCQVYHLDSKGDFYRKIRSQLCSDSVPLVKRETATPPPSPSPPPSPDVASPPPVRRTSPRKKKTPKRRRGLSSSSSESPSLESSLKGRMTTDPSTGLTTFLSTSFELLPSSSRYRCLSCPPSPSPTTYHRGSLKKHVLTLHSSLFSCPSCPQRCHSRSALSSHISRVHLNSPRPSVPCPVCGKPCSAKKGRLQKHLTTHLSPSEKEELLSRGESLPQWHKLRRHVCELCGRGYELRSHLLQHKIREHPSADYTPEERVASKEMCPDCGKLVHRHYLKKHQEFVHSSPDTVKRFCCALCEKRFVKEGDLRKHKRVVHENQRPWKCPDCDKAFAMKHQLTYHQNNHRNIRPWQCEHCPMGFARKHHLQRHLKIYHEPGANPRRKTYVRGPETKQRGPQGGGEQAGEDKGPGPEWTGPEETC